MQGAKRKSTHGWMLLLGVGDGIALAVLGGFVGFLGEFAVPFASARRLAVGKMRRGALGTKRLSFVLFADIRPIVVIDHVSRPVVA